MGGARATNRVESPTASEGVIRLLQSVKVPMGYKRVVQGRIDKEMAEALLLFTPQMDETDVTMMDSLVEVGEGTCVALVVENHGQEPIRLKKGTTLGSVIPVMEVEREEDVEGQGRSALVSVLCNEPSTARGRTSVLLEKLDLQQGQLSPAQLQQLQDFLTSYADIFAMDTSELGTTPVVTHSINTGEQTPIRQPIRRMPFALRSKVDELVGEMLSQGVVQPSESVGQPRSSCSEEGRWYSLLRGLQKTQSGDQTRRISAPAD